MDDFEKELKQGFLDEAEQSITDVEQSFLSLETDPHNNEHINQIFRLAHNLKGSSKAVGFDQFGQFTHQFESFVLRIKNNDLKANSAVISLLLKTTDFIKLMIQGLRNNLDASFEVESLLNEMKNFSQTVAVVAEPTVETKEISDATEASVISFPEKVAQKAHVHVAAAVTPVAHDNKNVTHDESIRVAMSKVEKLLNSVGEMVILQSVLEQNSASNNFSDAKKTIGQLSKVAKEIQDISMGLRMVPVKTTFQKMQRIVRDTAQLLNKDVNLTLFGEETELDKSVLENINDPLVHLIRNSVDHGIESTQNRVASGKPAQGNVILKAFHRSGRLVLEVIDDGGGLDAQKLKNIAIHKGILNETDVLSESESFKLIFAPGFSTKAEVTEVSGRGVGMDVVKTNIEKLGGEIQIESFLGKGTTIRITLPLTMAIVDGLVATYNNQKYI
ncbi:MAG: chemotaxis protein CheA, partial [Pseudobdellovibrio sp.]